MFYQNKLDNNSETLKVIEKNDETIKNITYFILSNPSIYVHACNFSCLFLNQIFNTFILIRIVSRLFYIFISSY